MRPRLLHSLVALAAAARMFAADIDPASGNAQPFPGTPIGSYVLAWSEEFNANAMDTTKWDFRTGVRFWSTQQAQNNSVSNGLLHILLKKETVGATDYTSGGLISKRAVRYGYYEARLAHVILDVHGWNARAEYFDRIGCRRERFHHPAQIRSEHPPASAHAACHLRQ